MVAKKSKKMRPCWSERGKTVRSKGGCFYFLGFLGSAIYYISTATGFWMGVLGFLKALVWPVFLVYGLLKFIGM